MNILQCTPTYTIHLDDDMKTAAESATYSYDLLEKTREEYFTNRFSSYVNEGNVLSVVFSIVISNQL